MIKLKKNERLVYAGNAALRAPDGTELTDVPQFVIVSVDEVSPAASVATLQDNERLILAGHIFNDKKRAEERFAALKAGREKPPREKGTPLYIVVDKDDPCKNAEEQNALNADAAKGITALFSLHMRRAATDGRRDGAEAEE